MPPIRGASFIFTDNAYNTHMDQSHTNFDFIMNSGTGPKKSLLQANSPKQRAIFVVIAVILLIILFVVGNALLSASSNAQNNKILDLAAYQSQLKSVIAIGAEKSRDENLRNKAITAKFTLESDYLATTTIIKNRGLKIPGDFTTRYSTASLVTQLEEADKQNNFDAEYGVMYTEKLGNYKAKLSEIYSGLAVNDQQTVAQFHTNVRLLLGESLTEGQ